MKKKFGFVLAAAILLAGCGQKKETTTTTARPVKTTIVESRSIIRKDFSGIVEAVEYVKLAFRVNGQIIQLPVIEGQKVKKGQLIAAIDPRDIALQYAATKSAYETASAQVERNKRLLSRQAISVQEYEISLANFQKAKSEYELSANNMRDTKLTAPFDGSIEKRLVENYQRVNSGEGIVQLVFFVGFFHNQIITCRKHSRTNLSGSQLLFLIRNGQCIGSKINGSLNDSRQFFYCFFYIIGTSCTMHIKHRKCLFCCVTHIIIVYGLPLLSKRSWGRTLVCL